jgi:hypothetical protein
MAFRSRATVAAREHDAGMPGEEQQQVELALRERHRPRFDEHLACNGIDVQVAEHQGRLAAGHRVDAAQDGVDARDQFCRREWLRDVVVGSEPQAGDPVRRLAAGG